MRPKKCAAPKIVQACNSSNTGSPVANNVDSEAHAASRDAQEATKVTLNVKMIPFVKLTRLNLVELGEASLLSTNKLLPPGSNDSINLSEKENVLPPMQAMSKEPVPNGNIQKVNGTSATVYHQVETPREAMSSKEDYTCYHCGFKLFTLPALRVHILYDHLNQSSIVEKPRKNKFCCVPLCSNSIMGSPNTLFFHVPSNIEKRKKWFEIFRIRNFDFNNCKQKQFLCCEDHFNERDIIVKYDRVKLRKNAVPNPPSRCSPSSPGLTFKKVEKEATIVKPSSNPAVVQKVALYDLVPRKNVSLQSSQLKLVNVRHFVKHKVSSSILQGRSKEKELLLPDLKLPKLQDPFRLRYPMKKIVRVVKFRQLAGIPNRMLSGKSQSCAVSVSSTSKTTGWSSAMKKQLKSDSSSACSLDVTGAKESGEAVVAVKPEIKEIVITSGNGTTDASATGDIVPVASAMAINGPNKDSLEVASPPGTTSGTDRYLTQMKSKPGKSPPHNSNAEVTIAAFSERTFMEKSNTSKGQQGGNPSKGTPIPTSVNASATLPEGNAVQPIPAVPKLAKAARRRGTKRPRQVPERSGSGLMPPGLKSAQDAPFEPINGSAESESQVKVPPSKRNAARRTKLPRNVEMKLEEVVRNGCSSTGSAIDSSVNVDAAVEATRESGGMKPSEDVTSESIISCGLKEPATRLSGGLIKSAVMAGRGSGNTVMNAAGNVFEVQVGVMKKGTRKRSARLTQPNSPIGVEELASPSPPTTSCLRLSSSAIAQQDVASPPKKRMKRAPKRTSLPVTPIVCAEPLLDSPVSPKIVKLEYSDRPERPFPSEVLRFACYHCGEGFTTKPRLKLHIFMNAPSCGLQDNWERMETEEALPEKMPTCANAIKTCFSAISQLGIFSPDSGACDDPFEDKFTESDSGDGNAAFIRDWLGQPVDSPVFQFTGPTPGFKPVPRGSSPFDYFLHFFPPEFFKQTCAVTNDNIERVRSQMPEGGSCVASLTIAELLSFFAVLLLHFSVLGGVPTWLGDYGIPVDSCLSYKRFQLLLNVICFPSRADITQTSSLLEFFNQRMKCIARPPKELLLQHASVLQKDKLIYSMVFSKSDYRGILCFLAGQDGLVHRVCLHRADKVSPVGCSRFSNPVIDSLMDGLSDRGHALYMNSFFCSLQLAEELLQRKTYCTGTIRNVRKVCPPQMQCPPQNTNNNRNDNMVPPTTCYTKDGICLSKWNVGTEFTCISSEFGASVTVQGNQPLPNLLHRYNEINTIRELHGVPPMPRLALMLGNLEVKLTLQIIAIMTRNAYLLYAKDCHNLSKLSFKEFLFDVVKHLLAYPVPVTISPSLQAHLPTLIGQFRCNSVVAPKKLCDVCRKSYTLVSCPSCPGNPIICQACYRIKHEQISLVIYQNPKKT